MTKPIFTGVCTALVTPFLENRLNTPMLRQLIRRQELAGVDALLICGTTGESAALTDTEKLELFKTSREAIPEGVPFIAGTGSNNTAHAVALSQAAQELGADALLVVSPYYNKATEEGLYRHYRHIAEAVSIPVILYNVPSRTGLDIPVSVYQKLAEIPNIVGVKEASSDIRKIAWTRHQCPRNFSVWCGNDDLAVPALSLGASGLISVVSNVEPELTRAMTKAALDGDFDTASDLQCKLLPLIQALFREVNPVPVKEALKQIGLDCGSCRLPLGNASPETKEALASLL